MYREKRDIFARALQRHFTGLGRWEVPPGGLFFWVALAQPVDTRQLLPRAIERGVAFMPGEAFFPDGSDACSAMRLNFSYATAAQIDEGVACLAHLVAAHWP